MVSDSLIAQLLLVPDVSLVNTLHIQLCIHNAGSQALVAYSLQKSLPTMQFSMVAEEDSADLRQVLLSIPSECWCLVLLWSMCYAKTTRQLVRLSECAGASECTVGVVTAACCFTMCHSCGCCICRFCTGDSCIQLATIHHCVTVTKPAGFYENTYVGCHVCIVVLRTAKQLYKELYKIVQTLTRTLLDGLILHVLASY